MRAVFICAAASLALAGCSLGNPVRDACQSGQECRSVFGAGFYCEASSGLCASALTPQCPEISPADAVDDRTAILFGTIFDRSSSNQLAREKAARLATFGLNQRGGIDGRRVALLHCDTSVGSALDAGDFLVEVGVPAIIGPSSSSDTETLFSAHRDSGVLVISPSATATQLGGIDGRSPGLLWRTAPPDSLQVAAIRARMQAAGVTELSIIARQNDTYAQSLSVLLQREAERNSVTVLASPQFGDPSQIPQAAADAIAGFPDVVVFVSSQVADAAAFLDAAAGISDYDATDLFLTDAAVNADLFTLTGDGSARYEQVTATRPSAPDTIVTSEFVSSYRAAYDGEDPGPFSFTAHAYDATALVLIGAGFALGTDDEVTGSRIAEGLTRVSRPGMVRPLLPSDFLGIIELLRTTEGVDVVGASGDLDYDRVTEELTMADYDVLVIATAGPPRFVVEVP